MVEVVAPDQSPNDILEVLRLLRGGTVWTGELVLRHKNGSCFPALTTFTPIHAAGGDIIGLVGIASDISRQKQAEEERGLMESHLRHFHKLEAVGTLAGGIAHDFNNILAAIMGFTEMAITDAQDNGPVQTCLEQVLKAAHRARDLVRQILAFSRQNRDQELKPVHIATAVEEALRLIRASLPATITIRLNIMCENATALADPTQLHQILVSLCTNAAHAMHKQGGLLEIGLDEATVDAQAATTSYPPMRSGHYLRLSVRDTGHGMDAATMERIFDPYFSTREVGKGSGLGLSIVHGIVKRHGGAVTVESQPGRGATFHVYLPKVDPAPKPGVEEKITLPIPLGMERILFVDDEEALTDLATKLLQKLGYQVTGVTSSTEAWDLFRSQPNDFDIVVTDYTMSEMTGLDLAARILRVRPDIPIILCTGFSDKVSAPVAYEAGIQEFLMKPVTRQDLAAAIRRALDGDG